MDEKNVKSVAIGIDFGTSNSSCCIIAADGKPQLARLPNEDVNIPSIVIRNPAGHQYGKRAAMTISDVSDNPQELRDLLPSVFWEFKRRLSDKILRKLAGRSVYPVDVIAEFVGYMLRGLGLLDGKTAISSVCMTHPVNFKPEQKEILRESLYRNGFCREIRLISEPVAAALGYESKFNSLSDKKGIIVFDFGGGTLDVAYVTRDESGKLIAPRKNAKGMDLQVGENVGGADLDMLIYRVAWQQIGDGQASLIADQSIKQKCQRLKERLTDKDEAEFSVRREKVKTFKMTRKEFESLVRQDAQIMPKLKSCLKKVLDAVAADPSLSKVDCFLPIGGSCRVPIVYSFLQSAMPQGALMLELMPDDVAVAMGAANYASGQCELECIRRFQESVQKWIGAIGAHVKKEKEG